MVKSATIFKNVCPYEFDVDKFMCIFIPILICIIVISGVFYIYNITMEKEKDEINELKELGINCSDNRVKCDWKYEMIECAKDCIDFGMIYSQYDYGRDASDECWCKLNNEIKQIW